MSVYGAIGHRAAHISEDKLFGRAGEQIKLGAD